MTRSHALKFYLDALKPQRRLLAIGLVMTAIEAGALTPIPKLVGYVVDRVAAEDYAWLDQHWWQVLVGIVIFLALFEPLAYFRQTWMGLVPLRVFFNLRVRLWRHIQGLSADFFARNATGDLNARIVADIQTAATTTAVVMNRLIWDTCTLIPVTIMVMWTSWPLGLFVITWACVQLYFTRRMMSTVTRQSREVADQLGQISTEATEKLDGHVLVRAFNREEDVNQRFEHLNRHHLSLSDRLLRYTTWMHVVITAPTIFQNALVALFGLYLARHGWVSTGDIVAVMLFTPLIANPINGLFNAMAQWSQALGAVGRVNDVFNALPSVVEKPDAVELPRGPGRIEFDHVRFTYPTLPRADASVGADGVTGARGVDHAHAHPPRPALDDLTLTVEPGQVVALVGPSGSGKTTVAQLLLRFYDVSEGAIRIDGHDLREVTLNSLRRDIGIVMQDSIIFAGSILDNLRFVRPDATEAQAWDALGFAALADYVASLPEGLHTHLGESGVNLSGGQRQRLSIARVFLKDPSILILDEATSALDTLSERHIQAALERLMAGRTTIVIAHRLATVRHADVIVVLENGRMAEVGDHTELIRAGGRYRELAEAQMLPGV